MKEYLDIFKKYGEHKSICGSYHLDGGTPFENYLGALTLASTISGEINSHSTFESLESEAKRNPDYHFYGKEEVLKVDEVRGLISEASTSSYSGGIKVFFIFQVGKLRKEAANALLKVVEEPLPGTYFILMGRHSSVLATIKSRTIYIKLPKLALDLEEDVKSFFYDNFEELYLYQETKSKEDTDYLLSSSPKSNSELEIYLEGYESLSKLKYLIVLYKKIDLLYINKAFLGEIEKLEQQEWFLNYLNKTKDLFAPRELLEKLMIRLIRLHKNTSTLEELLELKGYIKANVNQELLLRVFLRKL